MNNIFTNPLFWMVVMAASLDIYHNARIILYYVSMARLTTESVAVTKKSKEGFSDFFSLCGWGTHGIHILHIPVEIAAVILFVQNPGVLVPLLFFLIGSAVIHWRQADAAEAVVENFFDKDLALIAKLFTAGSTLEEHQRQGAKQAEEVTREKYRRIIEGLSKDD